MGGGPPSAAHSRDAHIYNMNNFYVHHLLTFDSGMVCGIHQSAMENERDTASAADEGPLGPNFAAALPDENGDAFCQISWSAIDLCRRVMGGAASCGFI